MTAHHRDTHSPARRAPLLTTAMAITAIGAALVIGGCASVGAPERSATLASFEQLTVQPDGTRSWRNTAAAAVTAVRIDPQAFVFGADVLVDEEDRQALRLVLADALTRQFAEAGVRVLAASETDGAAATLRVTFTAVALASPVMNAITTVLLFAPVSRGSLSVEIEAVDGADRQRIAAMAFNGKAGVENIGSAYTGVGHAKVQADIAAGKFVSLLTGAERKRAG
jgi:hypothetical protein